MQRNEYIELMTPDEVAQCTGIALKTLANWRVARKELPFVKAGGAVRYKRSDVKAWIAKNTVKAVM